jgi:hypothetical protein
MGPRVPQCVAVVCQAPPGPSTWSISTGYNRRVKMDQQLLIPETPSPVAPTPTSPKDVKKENSTTTRRVLMASVRMTIES